MYKVKFNDGEHICLFSELKSDVEACQLALALHQSSTIKHIVSVVDAEDLEIVSLKNFK